MAKPPHAQRGNSPQRQGHQKVEVRQVQQWSGPLPSPDALDRFNKIIPNGADRVVKMAEAEQAHRIDYERTGLTASTAEARRGQYVGGALSLAAIICAAYTSHIGAPWQVSVAFLSLPIMGMIRALIRPRG